VWTFDPKAVPLFGPTEPCTTTTTFATFSVAVCEPPSAIAVIVAAVGVVTDFVVTVKFAVVAPACTVTVLGTVAAGLLEVNATVVPLLGAAEASVTVPEAEFVPMTAFGLSVTEETAGPLVEACAVVLVELLLPPPQLISTITLPSASTRRNLAQFFLRLCAAFAAAPPHNTLPASAVHASDHGALRCCAGRALLTWLAAFTVNVTCVPELAVVTDGVHVMPFTVVAFAPPPTKQLTLIGEAAPLNVAVKLAVPPSGNGSTEGAPVIWKSAGAGGVVELPFLSSVNKLYASMLPSPVTRS
jgi:hypothetical protein